jgi:hypothetical protein
MSALVRQVLREVQKDAPALARSFRTSAAPKYHYVSGHLASSCVPTLRVRQG